MDRTSHREPTTRRQRSAAPQSPDPPFDAAADRELEEAAQAWTGDPRAAASLREHFAIEKALATRLRDAPAAERPQLYGDVYNELFERVPDHPQLRRDAPAERAAAVDRTLRVLRHFVRPEDRVAEIGAGDCALAARLAPDVESVDAFDVSETILAQAPAVDNLKLHVTDGVTFELPPDSVTLAHSNQLMEHLHPMDAERQLHEIVRILRPGGRYVIVTPNGLTGPWDISRLFSDRPSGFHLCEYSNRELISLLRSAGFSDIRAFINLRGRTIVFSVAIVKMLERVFCLLPSSIRRSWTGTLLARPLKTVRLVASLPTAD